MLAAAILAWNTGLSQRIEVEGLGGRQSCHVELRPRSDPASLERADGEDQREDQHQDREQQHRVQGHLAALGGSS